MINGTAKFRIGQQVNVKGAKEISTIYSAQVESSLIRGDSFTYGVEFSDGTRSKEDKYTEDELEPIGETPDLSLITYEQIGRKALAIHSLTGIVYTEGTKVIVLEGQEVSVLAHREDGTKIEQSQLAYRIIDFSEDSANWLYNNACKVMGFGMILQSAKYGWDNHIVLVNDNLAETLIHYDDIPF